jgi:hypothetical protein
MKDSAKKLIEAAEIIESFRRAVNEAYTQAPDGLNFDFSTPLDQLADYQYKLSQTWGKLINEEDSTGAETDAASIIEEAQRTTLSAWRAFAEARQKEAESFELEVRTIQADVSELVALKVKSDATFSYAVELHEKNERAALEELRKSEAAYRNYISNASERIAGTRAITRRERNRQRLVYFSAICAALAVAITIIGRENIIEFFRKILFHPDN